MRLLHVLARTGIFLVLLLEIAAGFYLTLGEETAWRQAVTRLVLYRWEALAASLALACLLLIDLLTLLAVVGTVFGLSGHAGLRYLGALKRRNEK